MPCTAEKREMKDEYQNCKKKSCLSKQNRDRQSEKTGLGRVRNIKVPETFRIDNGKDTRNFTLSKRSLFTERHCCATHPPFKLYPYLNSTSLLYIRTLLVFCVCLCPCLVFASVLNPGSPLSCPLLASCLLCLPPSCLLLAPFLPRRCLLPHRLTKRRLPRHGLQSIRRHHHAAYRSPSRRPFCMPRVAQTSQERNHRGGRPASCQYECRPPRQDCEEPFVGQQCST